MKLTTLKRKYKNQWVLANITKTNNLGQAVEAEALAHSKSRTYLYRRAKELQPRHFTIFFTGKRKKLLRI